MLSLSPFWLFLLEHSFGNYLPCTFYFLSLFGHSLSFSICVGFLFSLLSCRGGGGDFVFVFGFVLSFFSVYCPSLGTKVTSPLMNLLRWRFTTSGCSWCGKCPESPMIFIANRSTYSEDWQIISRST